MKILVFGTGDYYERYKNFFIDDVVGLIDNNKNKQGSFLNGKEIMSPETAVELKYDRIYVLSVYFLQMTEQLLALGIDKEKIFSPTEVIKLIKEDGKNLPLELMSMDCENLISIVKIIFPVHKNPVVRKIAHQYFDENPKVRLVEPLDVLDFHNYMAKCYLIMSDSGGVQEEAPALGKPVIVLRNTTERPEGIEAGTLKLAGTDKDNIYQAVTELLKDSKLYEKMSLAINPYGDGHASEKIVEVLLTYAKGIDRSSIL